MKQQDPRSSLKITSTSPQRSRGTAKKLIELDKIQAGIVASYHDAKLVAPMFERAKIPLIVLWDSSPKLEALGEYTFGIGTWLPSSGEVSANFAKNQLKASKVAILNTNTEWSLDVSAAFKAQS